MKGTTRCPHCNTRFRINEVQLTAHQGRVRCGQCHQAFDALPDFIQEQFDPATSGDAVAEQAMHAALPPETSVQLEHQAQSVNETDKSTGIKLDSTPHDASGSSPLRPVAVEHIETHVEPDAAMTTVLDRPGDTSVEKRPLPASDGEDTPFGTPPLKRFAWLWPTGIVLSVILLIAQSAYFFRVTLASHLPILKPALITYCHLLNCEVPLPQNSALMGIESSGLDADTEHDNLITLNALLRNRASYTLRFPMLALTLNDTQDKPLARRLFRPSEYLPPDESEQTGFVANHEVSVKLHLNTNDLKAAGYRLELFYSPDQNADIH